MEGVSETILILMLIQFQMIKDIIEKIHNLTFRKWLLKYRINLIKVD